MSNESKQTMNEWRMKTKKSKQRIKKNFFRIIYFAIKIIPLDKDSLSTNLFENYRTNSQNERGRKNGSKTMDYRFGSLITENVT
ncbi:hypothetical protein DERF_015854 [Dermatophagoides farinae]|uniref:Uncharacterized protein n=1 Tax=Dermatophagoides farinae TaxID=6954 RepID=A0A922HFF4_DERFA|nr:hypothetical protein DERF_015854 [Dermatophagoides farinae]